jgi:hypothetical protein
MNGKIFFYYVCHALLKQDFDEQLIFPTLLIRTTPLPMNLFYLCTEYLNVMNLNKSLTTIMKKKLLRQDSFTAFHLFIVQSIAFFECCRA